MGEQMPWIWGSPGTRRCFPPSRSAPRRGGSPAAAQRFWEGEGPRRLPEPGPVAAAAAFPRTRCGVGRAGNRPLLRCPPFSHQHLNAAGGEEALLSARRK